MNKKSPDLTTVEYWMGLIRVKTSEIFFNISTVQLIGNVVKVLLENCKIHKALIQKWEYLKPLYIKQLKNILRKRYFINSIKAQLR